jgi:Fic family protein
MRVESPTDSDLLARVRMEFVEMPGMRLTRPQAQRLWNLQQSACDEVLNTLVDEGFLKQASDGAFLRGGEDPR